MLSRWYYILIGAVAVGASLALAPTPQNTVQSLCAPRICIGSGNAEPVELWADGKPYLRISPSGIVTILNSSSLTVGSQMTIAPAGWSVGSMVEPAEAGTRFLCIDTAGVITSSATACSES